MTTHIVTIPRTAFDNALAQMTDYLTSSQQSMTIACGLAASTLVADSYYWTIPTLQLSHTLMPPSSHQAALIVVLEQGMHLSSMRWSDWCSTFLPTLTLDSYPVILLRMSIGGETSAIIRHHQRWQSVERCELSGAAMLQLPLKDQKSTATTEHLSMLSDPQGRYSRMAGAMGAEVLQRLQQSLFAIVGAGRTGSLLAHSLTRMGANVLIIDPDIVELHNLDGDLLLPVHEGLHKADALQRSLQPFARVGSTVQGRVLDIVTSQTAGRLLLWADVVISAVDNDAARMAVAAWCSALLKPHLDIGVAIANDHRIGADIRLTLPAQGCLACVGGFAQKKRLPELVAERISMANQSVFATHSDFRQQRSGSLRSINQIATNYGLRLIEQLYNGSTINNRHLRFEEHNALFSLRELNALPDKVCHVCGTLSGKGADALTDDTTFTRLSLNISQRLKPII